MTDNSTPILTPLLNLLHSRKFIVALVTALVDTLVLAAPALEPVRVELVTVFTTLALALIGGIAYEDGKEKGAPVTLADEQPALISSPEGMADKSPPGAYSAPGYVPPSDRLSKPHR